MRRFSERCYFGCKNDGPLHRFPPYSRDKYKYEKWKSVLDPKDQKQNNQYIEDNFKFCNRHFPSEYWHGKFLLVNAVPLLNTVHTVQPPEKENVDSTNVQNVLSGSNLELNVAQSSDNSIEQSVVTTRCYVEQNIGADQSTNNEKANSEVVWLPASTSPHQRLQEFLNFSKPAQLEDENDAPLIYSEDEESIASTVTKEVLEDESIVSTPVHSDNEESVVPSGSVDERGEHCFLMSKVEFCKEWQNHSEATGYEQDRMLFKYISSRLNPKAVIGSQQTIKTIISHNSFQLSEMWTDSGRDRKVFFQKYSGWLNSAPIRFPLSVASPMPTHPPSVNQPKQPQQLFNGPPKQSPPETSNNPLLLCMKLETNDHVFTFLKKSLPPFKPEILYVVLLAIAKDLAEENKLKILQFCNRYVSDMKFKWMTANNNCDVFHAKFQYWLQLNVRWPAFLKVILDSRKLKTNKTLNTPTLTPAHKSPLKCDIDTLEQELTKKCSENGNGDVSKIMHSLIHHPDDAARMRALLADSECHCFSTETEKSIVQSESIQESPEEDPLMVETLELGRTSALERQRTLPADRNKPIKRLYKTPSGVHRSVLKEVLEKLKAVSTDKVIKQTPLAEELNKTEPTAAKGLEFGPVLEKLIFVKSVIKNGAKVKLSNNKSGTAVKVANLKNATVLVPSPNAKSGTSVRVTLPNYKRGTTTQASHSNLCKTIVMASPTNIKSRTVVQELISDIESGTLESPSNIQNRTQVQATLAYIKSMTPAQKHLSDIKSKTIVQELISDIESGTLESPSNIQNRTQVQATLANIKSMTQAQKHLSDIKRKTIVQELISDIESGTLESPSTKSSVTKVQASPSIIKVKKVSSIMLPQSCFNKSVIPVQIKKKMQIKSMTAVQALLSDIKNATFATPSNKRSLVLNSLDIKSMTSKQEPPPKKRALDQGQVVTDLELPKNWAFK